MIDEEYEDDFRRQQEDDEKEMWEADRLERAHDMIEECKKWELL